MNSTVSYVLSSMTGQAEASEENSFGKIHIQIKSLNNRFKDFKFRLPANLQMTEIPLRKVIDSIFKRGSFDINVSIKYAKGASSSIRLDMDKVKNYVQQFEVLQELKNQKLELTGFLRPEFMKEVEDESNQTMTQSLYRCFDLACLELMKQRRDEGQKIRLVTLRQLEKLNTHLAIVASKQNESLEIKKTKLKTKLRELITSPGVDEQRVAQEFVFLAQKLDIQEEIDRFKFHWKKLEVLLSEKYEKSDRGKEIEFILQELGRETNTLSNKADHAQISHECVEIKVILESIREQILNLE